MVELTPSEAIKAAQIGRREAAGRSLWRAIAENDAAAIRLLREQGLLEPAVWASWETPPLVLAAHSGHAECVQELLPACDPNQQPKESHGDVVLKGGTALWTAIDLRRRACIDLLLPVSDPEKIEEAHGFRPLELAVFVHDMETTRALIGRTRLGRRPKGRTLLMIAAMSGGVEFIPMLLPLADPKAVDDEGKSAFAFSIQGRSWAFADAICDLSSRKEVSAAYRRHPERLPRWRAQLEREALAREAKIGKKNGSATDASGESTNAGGSAGSRKPATRI